MAPVVLVTGGCRSGKSRYALDRVARLGGARTYLATCPPALDAEMYARIERHRRQREGRGWITVEVALDPAAALAGSGGVVVVDCLTCGSGTCCTRTETGKKTRSSVAAAPSSRPPGPARTW